MKKGYFYTKLIVLILALSGLGYYMASLMSSIFLKGAVPVLTLILIFISLYLEINKQLVYLASHALLDEMDHNRYDHYINKSKTYDFMNLMNTARLMLKAFSLLEKDNYDEAYNLLLSQQDVFTENNMKQYIEYSYIVSILMYHKKEYKSFEVVYHKIQREEDIGEGSIVNIAYLNALISIKERRSKDAKQFFDEALETEKTKFMKVLIEREADSYEKK